MSIGTVSSASVTRLERPGERSSQQVGQAMETAPTAMSNGTPTVATAISNVVAGAPPGAAAPVGSTLDGPVGQAARTATPTSGSPTDTKATVATIKTAKRRIGFKQTSRTVGTRPCIGAGIGGHRACSRSVQGWAAHGLTGGDRACWAPVQ